MIDATLALALVVAVGVALKFRRDAYHERKNAELWRHISDGFEFRYLESEAQVAQLLEERAEYAKERSRLWS